MILLDFFGNFELGQNSPNPTTSNHYRTPAVSPVTTVTARLKAVRETLATSNEYRSYNLQP